MHKTSPASRLDLKHGVAHHIDFVHSTKTCAAHALCQLGERRCGRHDAREHERRAAAQHELTRREQAAERSQRLQSGVREKPLGAAIRFRGSLIADFAQTLPR